jgi:deoxyhypusine synthase
MTSPGITAFLNRTFRHFNAGELIRASQAFRRHVDDGGHVMITLAGAMSTAELGVLLAEMIRRRRIHAVCCTGANLEEDVFGLIARDRYRAVPNYRWLTPQDDKALFDAGLNRVTDTCIPERDAIEPVAAAFVRECRAADASGARLFPHEALFNILRRGDLRGRYVVDTADSWVHAAMELDLPMFVPGWEDCTLGNIYAANCISGGIKNVHTIRAGVEYMMQLVGYYERTAPAHPLAFLQIGGGIAGDFAICVVPLLRQDLHRPDTPLWKAFCQIGDSTTSYGSYSGAPPTEKITWGKVDVDTPVFMIESDATIVAPLLFAAMLDL